MKINFRDKINENFREDFDKISKSEGFAEYFDVLNNSLEDNSLDIKELLDFGIFRLPNKNSRPDNVLASYFIVISEIIDIPPEVRDLAMDAMLWSESGEDEVVIKNDSELKLYYNEKLRPLL